MHDRVRVQHTDGSVIAGTYEGIAWLVTPESEVPVLEVDTPGGELVSLTRDEVALIEPQAALSDVSDLLRSIDITIRNADVLKRRDTRYWSFPVSDHDFVEVSVSRRTTPCQPYGAAR